MSLARSSPSYGTQPYPTALLDIYRSIWLVPGGSGHDQTALLRPFASGAGRGDRNPQDNPLVQGGGFQAFTPQVDRGRNRTAIVGHSCTLAMRP